MKIKKFLAFSVAMTSALAAFGCGSSASGSSSEATTTVKKVEVQDTQEIPDIPDGAQKEIIWMGTYDLNPKKGADKTVEMTLFNNKGGTVKFSQVSDSEKFDKLAAALMSQKDVPDIFKYEWMAFPAQVLKDMYQPVDDIVDFSEPLWADVKQNADLFVMGGKHYVAPISFTVGTLMMYDQDLVDSEGLSDPYEEYKNGNWNWDVWYEMMAEFVDNAPADTERYGINGWYQTQLIQQTGKTMVNYDGEKFSSNLNDPDIERAENLLYDIGKNKYVITDWLGNARKALSDGNVLFYCMGTWAMTGNNGPTESDTWRVVPVPSDPNNDNKYMTADMLAYMWVKGSTANEAVKTWFECSRMANTDQEYLDNGKEKFLNANPTWTEDMYQVFMDCSSSAYQMVFDYGYGISSLLSDDNANEDGACVTRKLYENTNKTDDSGKQYTWSEVRDSYTSTVDAELKTINDSVAKFNKENG
ncbi:MAG: extracellular solute-binding protein [Ruminococcus sp.]|nr:extracellular solute-binding protein [Ruminococcus sp.]